MTAEHGLLAATVFVALIFCCVTAMVPAALVLPTLSVTVVVSGLLLGAYALLGNRSQARRDDHVLDIAGLLVLFGFAAAIVCDKTEALQVLTMIPA